VRAISYHETPRELSRKLEAHLRYYRRHFRPVMQAELKSALAGGAAGDRPGLLISFDDGSISNYEVAAPMLEKFGFRGWFFVCSGLIESHEHAGHDPKNYMTWAQIRDLRQRGHIVGSHTSTHMRLSSDVGADDLDREIEGSKNRLEAELDGEVDSFCWVGGEENSHSPEAARRIRRSGYRYAFTTSSAPISRHTDPLMIQRTNVDIAHSMPRIRLALSGAADIWFRGRRRRINEMLAPQRR
jgi:peptidoglycan/xylan/chitin deacetylase (PgdA/CDA1 family)